MKVVISGSNPFDDGLSSLTQILHTLIKCLLHAPPGRFYTSHSVQVKAHEPNLNHELALTPDLVALSMAIVPSEGTGALAHKLGVELSPEGFFMEAHLKMRPMDFMVEGVFVAGMAHYPKFIEEAISNAQAAAGRALTLLSKEPLYIGGTIAVVDQDKCVGCLTCVRTCPFEIPKVDATRTGIGGIVGAAWIDPALCQGCGTCTGECPATAIQLVNYRDEQMIGVPNWLGVWLPETVEAQCE